MIDLMSYVEARVSGGELFDAVWSEFESIVGELDAGLCGTLSEEAATAFAVTVMRLRTVVPGATAHGVHETALKVGLAWLAARYRPAERSTRKAKKVKRRVRGV